MVKRRAFKIKRGIRNEKAVNQIIKKQLTQGKIISKIRLIWSIFYDKEYY